MCLCIAASLSGCSLSGDASERVLTDYEVWNEAAGSVVVGDVVPDPTTTPAPALNYNLVVDPNLFEPLPYSVIACDDYSNYLATNVTAPLQSIAEEVTYGNAANASGSATYGKVYMNITHVGYVYDETTQTMRQGSRYNRTFQQSMSKCGGYTMTTYAKAFLEKFPINSNVLRSTQSLALSKLDASKLDSKTTWVEANAALTEGKNTKIDGALLSMWGQDKYEKYSYAQYRAAVSRRALESIPNISYSFYTSATDREPIVLNDTSNTTGYHYAPGISIEVINKLCNAFNPFSLRSTEVIDKFYSDEQSLLRVYLDGYTKTIIYIATEPGSTLKSVMGNKYQQAFDIISDAYMPKDISHIVDLNPSATIIPQGTKGVD